ncbi:EscU/YscU/HrcU family type III secretion system export apparatus switch protein [Sporosarcina thermotolerans]|uniref:EscU/YscU/HrcU family type III secretion system export apparatus switch protein n=1 Tax=Sporosarcina thermotolerans TaxID=633404 RepID=A0AAW9A4L6_9BACL|nr:EscU/YscU/HrcU family type III secretion system export apparatus switch protein [Sporosarcina thermotolerans]MDW0115749.1 EscU/YscU/HrcU family type III secretion system export apparatus switch protein [Sporosarcina thermotolerans]WHT47001.1 EscU/YscU/HrcU family type III secretion system export apparatus switch protein [Sporosarcina thermotolerans]
MMENKNMRKGAIALSYDPNVEEAPKIIAKGKGMIAQNIIEKAKEHDIPIQEDATLVALLGQLDVNETIPEQLYQAVAEVFAYIYHIDRNHGVSKKNIVK